MKKQTGFTIVELLIVIVVIGILAAIIIVAFNGVQNKAKVASLQSDITNAAKKLETYKVLNSGTYPSTLTAGNVTSSAGTTFTYNFSAAANTYCLSAKNGNFVYSYTSVSKTMANNDCFEDDLVTWLPMNGNALDQSPSKNDGTLTGATLTTGASGKTNGAYLFGNTTDYLLMSQQQPTNISSFTVSLWTKGLGANTTDYVYMARRGTANSIGASIYWLGILPNGFLAGAVDGHYGPGTTDVLASDSTWHMLTVTYDGQTQKVYVDGVVKASVAIGPIINSPDGTNSLLANGGTSSPYRPFNGSLDDFRIYNRVLGDAEVAALYGAGAQ